MAQLLDRGEEALLERLSQSQPQSAAELTDRLDRITRRVIDTVLGDARVRERVGHHRHQVLSADYTAGEDKSADDDRMYRLCEIGVYDYDDDTFVIARVDLRTGDVTDVFEREGVAPPITDAELNDAREIAAANERLRPALADERAQVVAFPAPTYTFEQRRSSARHRACVLFAEPPGGDTASAVVDLSARELIPDDELPEILRSDRRRAGGRPDPDHSEV